jgi:glycolate oxidase FAD binding subunit
MTEISLKVMPKPEAETTLVKAIEQSAAIVLMNRLSGSAKPISAASWYNNQLYLRLSGAASSVEQSAKQWSAEHGLVEASEGQQFWYNLREYQHDFFQSSEPIWRFSIKPSAAQFELGSNADALLDWSGAQRWVKGEYDPEQLNELAATAKGSVAKWRGGDRAGEVNFPMNTAMQQLQQRLKRSLDPKNILNPGRIYSWL